MPNGFTPQAQPPNPTPSGGTVSRGVKLWLLVVLLIGIILAAAALLVLNPLTPVFSRLVENDVKHDTLSSETQQTPDVTISAYQCGAGGFSWSVVERDGVTRVDALTPNATPEIYRYRVPVLYKGTQTIAESRYRDDEIANSNFPIGEHFIEAYVMNRSVFATADPENKHWIDKVYEKIDIPSSVLSQEEFSLVSRCLHSNLGTINQELNAVPSPYPARAPIGWLTLIDDSVKKVNGLVAYSCSDGKVAAIMGRRVAVYATLSDVETRAQPLAEPNLWLGLDGTISTGGADTKTVSPGSLPQCSDGSGQSLEDFIRTIPARIQFLD